MAGLGVALVSFTFLITILGFLIILSAYIWTIILAFMEHITWGIASLFIPYAILIFVVIKLEKKWVKRSFLLQVFGWLMILLGGGLTLIHGKFIVSNKPRPITSASERNLDPSQSSSVSPSASASISPTAQADDPFREAVNKAMSAAQQTQTAKTSEQWAAVTTAWQEAINLMKTVPANSPNYAVAQQKVQEYQKNLAYAKKIAQKTKAGS